MSTRILNFTFHGIGEPPPATSTGERDVWLSDPDFLSALDAIAASRAATISFDDGNASDLSRALPALLERGLRGRFFVVADRLSEPGYLGPEDLRRLHEAGMEIGLHGMRHRPWRRLSDAELDEELDEARRLLEAESGVPVPAAACPFGAYDRRVLGRLRRAGFRRVFTSDGGWASAGAWLQPRNTLREGDDGAAIERIAAGDGLKASGVRTAKRLVKRWR